MPHRHATGRRTLLLASSLLLGLALPAWPPAWAEEAPPYVTARQLDLTVLLAPPPDAAVQRIEIDRIIAVQAEASPERIAQAVADAKEALFDMFGGILGASLAPSIAMFLAERYSLAYVGYYLAAAGALTLIALLMMREDEPAG